SYPSSRYVNLILRPSTPPCAFTYLKYASDPRATFPPAAASPLSGTLEPRWISVDETPGVASGRAPAEATITAATKRNPRTTRFLIPTNECTTDLLEAEEAGVRNRR